MKRKTIETKTSCFLKKLQLSEAHLSGINNFSTYETSRIK